MQSERSFDIVQINFTLHNRIDYVPIRDKKKLFAEKRNKNNLIMKLMCSKNYIFIVKCIILIVDRHFGGRMCLRRSRDAVDS